MSPEQQRIAIAKACGAQIVKAGDGLVADSRPFIILTSQGHILSASCPDYLNDLNAMHEAEKVLMKNDDLFGDYCDVLYDGGGYSATAAQRAEAFLRTFNLWEDAE